jgi:hypothetical protein
VNKQVCRSFGRVSNRYESSGAKVGVRSRSASSRTYIKIVGRRRVSGDLDLDCCMR